MSNEKRVGTWVRWECNCVHCTGLLKWHDSVVERCDDCGYSRPEPSSTAGFLDVGVGEKAAVGVAQASSEVSAPPATCAASDELEVDPEAPVWLKELHYKNGKIEAHLEGPFVSFISDLVSEYFTEKGGINFVGFRCWAKEIGEAEVTIQRVGGMTPYMKYEQGLHRIAELEAEVARLQSAPQHSGVVATELTEDDADLESAAPNSLPKGSVYHQLFVDQEAQLKAWESRWSEAKRRIARLEHEGALIYHGAWRAKAILTSLENEGVKEVGE